jgi:hypothetical protein
MRRSHVLASTTVVLSACVAGGGDAGGITFRDSAGMTIVESPGHDWADLERWSLSDGPVVEIGRAEGEDPYLLSRVVAAFRTSDGRIVVANGQTAEFRFFDSDGRYQSSAGGQGRGPGELRALFNVALLPGDTLVAVDGATGYLDWFDPQGTFVRRTKVEFRTRFPPPSFAEGLWMLPDRSFLIRVWESPEGPTGEPYRPPSVFVRLDPASSRLDTLGRYGGLTNFGLDVGRQRPFVSMTPFARTTHHTIAGERVYVGDSETYEIEVYTLEGELERLIRRRVAPRRPTQENRERAAARYRGFMEQMPAERRPEMERWLAAVPYEETLPAFYGVWADRVGNVWVRESASLTEPDDWAVFTRDGSLTADITLPARFVPFDAGRDYVLGVWRDELEVEYVRMYDLRRP